jgi:hypothetical protein
MMRIDPTSRNDFGVHSNDYSRAPLGPKHRTWLNTCLSGKGAAWSFQKMTDSLNKRFGASFSVYQVSAFFGNRGISDAPPIKKTVKNKR